LNGLVDELTRNARILKLLFCIWSHGN
jgi:hypothetical protein